MLNSDSNELVEHVFISILLAHHIITVSMMGSIAHLSLYMTLRNDLIIQSRLQSDHKLPQNQVLLSVKCQRGVLEHNRFKQSATSQLNGMLQYII